MNTFLGTLSTLGLLAFTSVASGASPAPPEPMAEATLRHLTLSRSEPAANSTVPSPSEIRLHFSQQPQRGSTSLTLTRSGGGTIEVGDVTVDPGNNRAFSSTVSTPLAPGSYVVAWRTMASDGHVIRGDFRFIVAAD